MLAIRLGLFITGASFASAWVDFDKGLINDLDLHHSFPVLGLGPPAKIPPHLLTEFISSVAPNASLVRNETLAAQFAYNNDQLIAYVDETSGETKVYPNLVGVQPAHGHINISRAFQFLRLNQTFPLDHTNIFLTTGSSLFGSTLHQSSENNSSSNARRYLTHAVVRRNVTSNGRSYSICGAGSTASFGFTQAGVRSLAYQWHPAKFTGQEIKPNSTDKIYDSIKNLLEPFGQQTRRVKVDGLDVCFYDSAVGFIQPVIRYRATLHSDNAGQSIAAPTPLLGYIAIGEGSPEPISTPESNPVAPTDAPSHAGHTSFKRAPGRPEIKVGRYVVREDAWEFVTNAINFLKGLQHPIFFIPSLFAKFVDSQYYWAQPFMFTTEKNSYINSVHLAQVEVHGNWHGFSTLHSGDEWVSLSDVPEEGYGGGAGGVLSYWLIRSCSVIPSPDDYAPKDWRMAFDPWFRLFNGLHAVAGARTPLWIADHSNPAFGRRLSLGAEFVFGWLETVENDPSNAGHPIDSHTGKPIGKASAVAVCGHQSDRVWQLENLGRPSCLIQYWYAD
ncbi:hypothetical protein M413DRAFT_258077 [Hebeloma cylindrosporum]|uniref:Uncharacterized protein n=1 Tax=Hebeloma cylindrosporum TaxID=76867 RepID=A0A0C3C1X9_HEBCY|nr:hypothetical protein M413DRAFT_258077 [Hebeloma cylindrosporum h7]